MTGAATTVCCVLAVVVLAAFVQVLVSFDRSGRIPDRMIGNPVAVVPEIISESAALSLRALVKTMGREGYATNINDLDSYTTTNEHVGEARPIGADGRCDHPFLVPSQDGTLCVLAGRIDIGRHFIISGGVDGLRESYETLISRTLSFGKYMFNLTKYPEAAALFESPQFIAAAKKVCPPAKQHLDPFQFNFIMQVPGQTVPLHVDGAYFWGATRFQMPQWLLAAMVFSGLFQDLFVDQVQVVAYLHEWEPATRTQAGEFIHWASAAPQRVVPSPRAGTAVDGSKTVHAAVRYAGRKGTDATPPPLDKSVRALLRYEGGEEWSVSTGVPMARVRNYTWDDLRISLVYRGRCFASAEEATRYAGNGGPPDQMLSIDAVLRTFSADLVRRGIVGSVEDAMAMDRLKLSIKILDTYIAYPMADNIIPWNYCAVARLQPWLAPLFNLFC